MATGPLPIRITPHALLATLVEVQYNLRSPLALVLGVFSQALRPDFAYEQQLMDLVEQQTQQPAEPLFQGKGVSIRMRADRLVFNCISVTDKLPGSNGDYMGWDAYLAIVSDVLARLHGTGELTELLGVAVRYVNALPGIQLNQQLQIQLPTLGPLPAPDSTYYRATFADEAKGFRIALQLTDRQQVAGRAELSSVFDITVRADTPQADLPALLARLDQAHTREKEVFFGLLDDEYLARLDPIYAE